MGLMDVLSNIVHWLPVEDDMSRLSFGVTLLLTSMASMIFTADKTPVSGIQTWMDRWQSWCIIFTLLPILESAAVGFICRVAEAEHVADVKNMEDPSIHKEPSLKAIAVRSSLTSCHRSQILTADRARELDWLCRVLMPLLQIIMFSSMANDPHVSE